MSSRFFPAFASAVLVGTVGTGAFLAAPGVAPVAAVVPVGLCLGLGAGLAQRRAGEGRQGAGAW